MTSILGSPLTLPSGLRVPHRIVKAAMTENLADRDNQPSVRHERLYRRWARGADGGLLVMGNLMVDRRFLERSRNIVADDHLDVAALRRVREAAAGSPVVAQVNHPGRQTNRFVASRPVAPSAEAGAVPMLGLFGRPRALSADEIETVVAGFGRAAALCADAGLDGVQVHAAHGYLLAQFLSPHVNRRDDAWGGDVAGRARALVGAVRASRARGGDGFTVSVKLNSSDFRHGGFTEDDAERVVRMLVDEGVDLIEVSGGTYESPALFGEVAELAPGDPGDPGDQSASVKEAYFAAFARRARAASGEVPIMLTGGIRTRAAMEALLGDGGVDLIGLARPIAIDPDLPSRLLAGAPGASLPRYTLPTVAGLAGESEWYEHQIGRLGAGRDVKPSLHPVVAASTFVGGELVRGLSGRRRRAAYDTQAGTAARRV
jgi:2,4-dienoyl-CoA reductase-like NADH-dependent reductase (Old Yellow Enzyme family)